MTCKSPITMRGAYADMADPSSGLPADRFRLLTLAADGRTSWARVEGARTSCEECLQDETVAVWASQPACRFERLWREQVLPS